MKDSVREARRLRVVLVGRSPVEAKLRRDPDIELLRARTPTDGLGELGQALAEDPKTTPAVLLGEGLLAPDELADFRRAAVDLLPDVRLLGVTSAAPSTGLDGAIPPDADADALRTELERASRPPRPSPTSKPAPSPKTKPAPGTDPETEILESLLAGRDPTLACISKVREQAAAPLEFVPEQLQKGAIVKRGDRVFGTLVSTTLEPAALSACAERLGRWLAIVEQHRQLRIAAFTDSLTGAWNRRYFDRFLASAIDRARSSRRDLTVLVFDIDDFKSYNDRFGHAAGDDILSETVRLLQSVIRPTDLVCRIGGDEFAVIFNDPEGPRMPGSRHPASIADLAARFQRQVVEHRFPKLARGAPCTLTISGGLATFPWDGATAQALLERADELAIASKRQGKNVITFGPGADRCCRGESSESPTPQPDAQ